LSEKDKYDLGLDSLLQLNNEIFPMDNGYWTKIEAKRVIVTKQIPHGIRYSLTLHNRNNIRILGYDNSHGIKPKKKKYGTKRIVWDHRHKKRIVEPYEFETPAQLLEDFWSNVEKILIEDER
jgi:hypothetical protein